MRSREELLSATPTGPTQGGKRRLHAGDQPRHASAVGETHDTAASTGRDQHLPPALHKVQDVYCRAVISIAARSHNSKASLKGLGAPTDDSKGPLCHPTQRFQLSNDVFHRQAVGVEEQKLRATTHSSTLYDWESSYCGQQVLPTALCRR